MMPGGSYSSYALSTNLCTAQSSSTCGDGGLWDVKGGQDGIGYPISYEPSIDLTDTSGLYMMGPIYAQNLNIGTGGNSQTSPNSSVAAVNIGNQTLPNGNQIDLEVGALALGANDQQQVFTLNSDQVGQNEIDAWIFPGYLYNKSLANSYSFSLHIGSTAFDYPGSMLFGGFDKGRAIGPGTTFADSNPMLQDIVLGVETGGSPWKFDSKKGLLLTNTSQNEPISASIDPLQPYLFLPKQTCDKLASQLPVTFDSSGYYLWDTSDPTYMNITTSAAYLGFVFPPATGDTADVTIKVPFQLLVLNLTTPASGKSGLTPYFPCMPQPDSNYVLGRAFLQAAFYGRNWNRHVSWLAQAPGPGSSKTGLGVQLLDIQDSDTTLDFYQGDQYYPDSWSSYWSPLPGGTDDGTTSGSNSKSSGGLSTGAKAGIGVGVGVVALAAIALLLFFCLRRRRKSSKSEKPDSASQQEPFVNGDPHYGNDAKALAPGHNAHSPHDAHSLQNSHSPHSQPSPQPMYHALDGSAPNQQHYGYYQPSPYKDPPPPAQQETYEMSGTIVSPATELPGHVPHELEAPHKAR